MKKNILSLIVIVALGACTASNNEKAQDEPITAEQETEIVEEITQELDEAQKEVKMQTEETLQEVDSILENF